MSWHPPVNFGHVEEDLYRSGLPEELNLPFLEKLRLKTFIYLAPEVVPPRLQDFFDDQNITVFPLGLDSRNAPWKPVSEQTVLRALKTILDPANFPILISCHLGRHRTGTVVGCLRKLQRWSLTSILAEYRRHAGGKVRNQNEQFMELFDTDLIAVPLEAAALLRISVPPKEEDQQEEDAEEGGAVG